MVNTQILPDPLNIALEISAFSGNNHKIYLADVCTLIPNGGGTCATDWLNPTDGLAEYWALYQLP